jgi:hypothetical protein
MQEQRYCPRHPGVKIIMTYGTFTCRKCVLYEDVLPPARLLTLKELFEQAELPSLEQLCEKVDAAIMEFLWAGKDGTLINLFLYFNSERKPLNPREFLEFWDSLSGVEEDYYMIASAEGLRSEVKGENE